MSEECNFTCPKCKLTIIKHDKKFSCEKCDETWDIINDIPYFSHHNFYWNRIPKNRLDQLNAYAREHGWKTALHDLLPENEKYLVDYATHPSRAELKNVIPLDLGNCTVLDLGCHMGGLSFLLANTCMSLVAADSTFENLEFIQIRKVEDGIKNIFPVCIDPLDFASLPFPDSYFDLVVLNGVLEWVGAVNTDLDPRTVQINALKEIRRIIKPGGYIYIGIENRFSYSYFLGSHDHSGLPFTSILPRKLANFVTKIKTNSSYRTYIYSYWGYKSLLEEAGFSEYEIYLAIPSYRYPQGILNINDRARIKAFIKNNLKDRFYFQIFWNVLVTLHLDTIFSNSFSIVAHKSE